eukprot:527170-Amorphochlora_amoeboformis.AAC.3
MNDYNPDFFLPPNFGAPTLETNVPMGMMQNSEGGGTYQLGFPALPEVPSWSRENSRILSFRDTETHESVKVGSAPSRVLATAIREPKVTKPYLSPKMGRSRIKENIQHVFRRLPRSFSSTKLMKGDGFMLQSTTPSLSRRPKATQKPSTRQSRPAKRQMNFQPSSRSVSKALKLETKVSLKDTVTHILPDETTTGGTTAKTSCPRCRYGLEE